LEQARQAVNFIEDDELAFLGPEVKFGLGQLGAIAVGFQI